MMIGSYFHVTLLSDDSVCIGCKICRLPVQQIFGRLETLGPGRAAGDSRQGGGGGCKLRLERGVSVGFHLQQESSAIRFAIMTWSLVANKAPAHDS